MLNNIKYIPEPILNSAINHMATKNWIHFRDLKTRPEVIEVLIDKLVDQLSEKLDERAENL